MKAAIVMTDSDRIGALERRFRQRLPELSVQVAHSADHALALFRRNLPNLIVSAAAVGGVSGLELLGRVRGDAALRDVPFILLDETVLDTFSPSPCEVVLDSCAHPAVVVAAASSLLVRARSLAKDSLEDPSRPFHGALSGTGRRPHDVKMSGTLEVLSLFDLVLSLTQKRTSGRLYLLLGGTEALLFFQQGHFVHAAFGVLVGEAAVIHIFAAVETHQDAEFYYEPTDVPLPPNGVTLTVPVQELLLKVAIALDQQRAAS